MTQTLWIPGPLPGFNDWIKAAKGYGGRGIGYSKLKRQWTDTVAWRAKAAKLQPVTRCHLRFVWHEQRRNRDPDNVAAGGRKAILDGLAVAGVLANDGWDQIAGWNDTWTASDTPGVEVSIFSVDGKGDAF